MILPIVRTGLLSALAGPLLTRSRITVIPALIHIFIISDHSQM